MARPTSIQASERPARPGPARPLTVLVLVLGLIATALLVALALVADRAEMQRILDGGRADVATIAELRVAEVVEWRGERLQDAAALAGSDAFRDAVRTMLHPETRGSDTVATARVHVADTLGLFEAERSYVGASLVDADGRLIVPGPPGEPDGTGQRRALVESVLRSGTPALGDPYLAPADARPSLDLAAPVMGDDGSPAAVVILRIDPELALYPGLATWPAATTRGATLLLARDGDVVRVIGPDPAGDGPLSRTIPLSRTDDPLVRAATGEVGLYEGADASGAPVLADMRGVPGSAWALLTQMDASALGDLIVERGRQLVLMGALVALLAAMLAATLFLVRQRRLLSRAIDAEQQRRSAVDAYDRLLSRARDSVLVVDAAGTVLDANAAACAAYRLDRSSLRGRTLRDLRAPDAAASTADDLDLTTRPGAALYETVHQRSDGSTFPVEVSTMGADEAGGKTYELVVRDISGRRQAEQETQEQLDELRRWQAGTIGREERILALKAEVNTLLAGSGQPPRYAAVATAATPATGPQAEGHEHAG